MEIPLFNVDFTFVVAMRAEARWSKTIETKIYLIHRPIIM
jgi:hypothetical protein